MSTLEFVLTLGISVLFLLALVFFLMWHNQRAEIVGREQHWMQKVDDAEVLHADLYSEILSIANAPWSRYEVVLADWGPDFTDNGKDGLPRWRWEVLDADRAVKAALGRPVEIGSDEVPFILGNEPHPDSALLAAVEWIEQQENPRLSVVIGEVTPWRADL